MRPRLVTAMTGATGRARSVRRPCAGVIDGADADAITRGDDRRPSKATSGSVHRRGQGPGRHDRRQVRARPSSVARGEPHSWFIGFAPAEAPRDRHRGHRRAGRPRRRGRGAHRRRPDGAATWRRRGDRSTTRRRRATEPATADAASPRAADDPPAAPRERRPLLERIGLAGIAAVLATLFGGVAVASWVGGEPFLAVMGGDRLPDDGVGRRPDPVPRLTRLSRLRGRARRAGPPPRPTPGTGSARRERRFRFEDLRDRAETRLVEVPFERSKDRAGRLRSAPNRATASAYGPMSHVQTVPWW